MKKTVFFTVVFFCIITYASAQKIRFGVQGGSGMSTATTDFDKEFTETEAAILGISKDYPVFSYGANIYAAYSISEKWGIAIEPGIIRKGFAKKVAIGNNKIEKQNTYLNYFQFPIIAEIFLDKNLTLTAGPEVSYLLNAKNVAGNESKNISEDFSDKKIDIALQFGIYYTWHNNFDIGLKGGVSATRLGKFAILNYANGVVAEYNRRNAYGHIFFRVKL